MHCWETRMHALYHGTLRFMGELLRAAGHGKRQAPSPRYPFDIETPKLSGSGRGTKGAEQTGRMETALGYFWGVRGAAYPCHRFVSGGDCGQDVVPWRTSLCGNGQSGRNYHGAGMAIRRLVRIVQLIAMR